MHPSETKSKRVAQVEVKMVKLPLSIVETRSMCTNTLAITVEEMSSDSIDLDSLIVIYSRLSYIPDP